MKKISKTVVFFGSGPVAAESLRRLNEDFTVEAVITKPRAQRHKGPVPVIELAESLGLDIYTADSKSALDKIFDDHQFKSDVAILIDFGIIVSKKVIDYFSLGIINSHFSILPEWRGADPITFALLSGQKKTGVSLMILVEKMDEGPLLHFEEVEIPSAYDNPKLTQALIECSNSLLRHIMPKYIKGEIKPFDQEKTERKVSYSRKISALDSRLDFTKTAETLEREIRAYIGWPGSKIELKNKSIIITKAHISNEYVKPGVFEIQNKNVLLVGTSSTALSIDELKPAGKNNMNIKSFLAGNAHLF
jgi:methionyl-tRNA formyltransferase